jgi:hypothetical protein
VLAGLEERLAAVAAEQEREAVQFPCQVLAFWPRD